MVVQIKFRRGTATEWTAANPVLAEGELGIETDTSQFKLGDGATVWNSLGYGGIQGPQGPQGDPGSSTGDVAGPSSATDNAVVRFDETTGKLVQNSAVTIDDSGSVNIPSGQSYKKNGTALAAADVGAIAAATAAVPVRSIFLSGAGGYPATTLPDAGFVTVEGATNKVDYRGTKFAHSATALSYHVWAFPMPENYDGGTMTAEFYWATNTVGATGDIRWVIQMLIRGNDDPIDAAWGTAVGVTDTVLAVNDVHISATSGAITPAGTPAGGKKLFVRVARDFENGDTSTADAILLDVYLHYGTDHYSDV